MQRNGLHIISTLYYKFSIMTKCSTILQTFILQYPIEYRYGVILIKRLQSEINSDLKHLIGQIFNFNQYTHSG